MPGKLAIVAVMLLVAAAAVLRDGGEPPVARIPDPPTRGVPPQFAEMVAGMKRAHRAPFPRAGGSPGPSASAERPFADRGSRRQIARLRRDVVRALRAASTPDDRVAVLAWQGVYVSGRRAVALADLRRAVRTRRGLPFRRLPPVRTRLELERRAGAWRLLTSVAG